MDSLRKTSRKPPRQLPGAATTKHPFFGTKLSVKGKVSGGAT